MFKWLPVYNYLVMVATLLYQSPFERLLGPWAHQLDDEAPPPPPPTLLYMHARTQ